MLKRLFCKHEYKVTRLVTGDEKNHRASYKEYTCSKCGDITFKHGADKLSQANKLISELDYKGEVSDGSHTFDELYYHRMVLFAVICNTHGAQAWKSWKHHDGTMFDDYFVVGIQTVDGQFTYHYHKNYWTMFNVEEYDFAPEWDGHESKDIVRLLSLI